GQMGQGNLYGTTAAPRQVIAQVRADKDSPLGAGKVVRYEYLNNVRKIVAAGNFAYALKNDGTVWAWGRNDSNQLGLGDTYKEFLRVPFATQMLKGSQASSTYSSVYLQEIIDIAAGGADDAHGFGYFIQSVYRRTQVEDHENPGQLATKFVNLTDNVFGVGDNSSNQLSLLSNTKTFAQPQSIRVSSGIAAQVSIGTGSTGSILVGNGTIMNMGDNSVGQFGNGTNTGTQGTTAMGYRAMGVSSGSNAVYAITYLTEQTEDGAYVRVANYKNNNDITANLYGWGQINGVFNAVDENGEPVTSSVNLPTRITTDLASAMDDEKIYRGQIVEMGGGSAFYSLSQGGDLVIYGASNSYGQQGGGTLAASGTTGNHVIETSTGTAKEINGALSVEAATGGYFTGLVDQDGYVWTFGQNNVQQLGNQGLAEPHSSTALRVVSTFALDAEVYEATLITPADATLPDLESAYNTTVDLGTLYDITYTWDGSKTGFNLLGKVPGGQSQIMTCDLKDVNSFAGGVYTITHKSLDPSVATVDANGLVTAVGYGETYILTTVTNGGYSSTLQFHIRVAEPFHIGWYDRVKNTSGEGDPYSYELKVKHSAQAYATVAVGEDYTIALKADGTVWAWGRNTYGQLGVGNGTRGGVESAPQQLVFKKQTGYRKSSSVHNNDLEDFYTVSAYKRALAASAAGIYANSQNYKDLSQGYEAVYNYGEIDNMPIVKIAAGMDFAMAIDQEGTLYTWGRNTAGQIGNGLTSVKQTGDEVFYSNPTPVEYFRDLKSSTGDAVALPIADIFAGAVSVSDGREGSHNESYAMAISQTGDLFVWGTSGSNQIISVNGQSKEPFNAAPSKIVDVSATNQGTVYALNMEGQLMTWDNTRVETGSVTYSNDLPGGARAVALEGGRGNTFYTAYDAAADKTKIFGLRDNTYGQMGNIAGGGTYTELTELAGYDIKSITGGMATMAVTSDHKLLASGANTNGELGDDSYNSRAGFLSVMAGQAESYVATPITNAGYMGTVTVNGYTLSIANTDGGRILSDNGDPTVTYTFVPDNGYQVDKVYVDGVDMGGLYSYTFTNVREAHVLEVVFAMSLDKVVHADTGMGLDLDMAENGKQRGLSSAILTDGSVYTWGNNELGQMGNKIIGIGPLDTSVDKLVPNYVDGYVLKLENVPEGVRNNRLVTVYGQAEVKNEDGTTSVVKRDITANWKLHPVIYYFNVYNEMPVERNRFAKYVFTSTDPTVATVDAEGRLTYTGVGQATIIIQEIPDPEFEPDPSKGLKTMLEVEVLPDNTNYYEKANANSNEPLLDEDGNRVLAYNLVAPTLASGLEFSIVLSATGYAYSFGSNASGQLGVSTFDVANEDRYVNVKTGYGNMVNMTSVAAGNNYALASSADGYVYGWGQNMRGSLGLNREISSSARWHSPQKVYGPGGRGYLGDESTGKVVKVYAYGNSSAALTERGEVYVWGDSSNYQLGARDDMDAYRAPYKVPGVNNAIEVYLSENNMVILMADTSVWVSGADVTRIKGWGDLDLAGEKRVYEQNGETTYTKYPMPMLAPVAEDTLESREEAVIDPATGLPSGETETVLLSKPTAYMENVIYAGAGTHQAIMMTEELVLPDESVVRPVRTFSAPDYNADAATIAAYEAAKTQYDTEMLEYLKQFSYTKHLYMLGQDVDGLLGTLLAKDEDAEKGTDPNLGKTGAYVNLPKEYDYFQKAEYNRLVELATSAYEAVTRYTSRYDDNWKAVKGDIYTPGTYEYYYKEFHDDLVTKNGTEPTRNAVLNAMWSATRVSRNASQAERDRAESIKAAYQYITTNPDWIENALEETMEEIEGLYQSYAETRGQLQTTQVEQAKYNLEHKTWRALIDAIQAYTDDSGTPIYKNYEGLL
ncbi:MAG: hypothetical protein NC131_15780, partial [Roseburia sp.]|nr:hypothetical protein [Roseburia sp.]